MSNVFCVLCPLSLVVLSVTVGVVHLLLPATYTLEATFLLFNMAICLPCLSYRKLELPTSLLTFGVVG